MDIVDRVRQTGLIPVVSIPRLEQALPLAESLLKGGLPCAEVTFRTAAAAESMAEIRARFPEILLGAGTVLTIEQVETAINAGAQFIVSPGTNPAVVDYCLAKSVPIFPGVCTPTEIELALAKGVDVLKFFPAEQMGGVGFLKTVCAPYRQVRFIPTGGIDTENLGRYLALPEVVACGGSWMVRPELMNAGEFDRISQLVKEAVALVNDLRK
ncbi:MAG: bifunctional 4-hydroxy-2-oxoglutarate aldolase/2-dehydro-3-deoxy-phosphogluconate aldolase [Blastocatellia bacterium]|nr:bifunctional 4-hydroxy-2-oxoglutarate aldolase/2-dehydro-3-deoxy-phosphogluconate aldolase [Blastocatellia bacterium]